MGFYVMRFFKILYAVALVVLSVMCQHSNNKYRHHSYIIELFYQKFLNSYIAYSVKSCYKDIL